MPKVFISHSWEDNEISRKLAKYLKRDGAEVWIDYARIEGGDSLPDAIGEGIEWCDVFLLVWSKLAKDSYYVKLERNCAIDNRKRIIPCVIDNEKLPIILTPFFRIDFKDFEQGYRSLAGDLKLTIIKKEPKVIPPKKVAPKPDIVSPERIVFSSNPQVLSKNDAKSIAKKYNFFDIYYNNKGKGLNHQYEQKIIKEDIVIIDNATGLMWQQGGSSNYMKFKDAKNWIKELNRNGSAGFNDWRLPTLEEAMSLMEKEKKNDTLYIDSIFVSEQRWIWTVDQVQGEPWAWIVGFSLGYCETGKFYDGYGYVRAVRSA